MSEDGRGGSYPMRVVARLTGLTPDVIRAWERRYGAIVPDRTEGNARRYSSADVSRLELLRDAVALGHQIGTISALDDDALRGLSALAPAGTARAVAPAHVEAYLQAMARWDLRGGEAQLARAASLHEPRTLVLDVVAPILREVGDRWERGTMTVAQEHAVSAQMRALLGTVLRTATVDAGAPRIVCCAPEGHEHELGAMIGAVLAALRGMAPVYLGPNVPLADLERTVRSASARVALLAIARDVSGAEATRLRRAIGPLRAHVEVWLGLPRGHRLASLDDVRAMHSFEELEIALTHRAGIVSPRARGADE